MKTKQNKTKSQPTKKQMEAQDHSQKDNKIWV